MQCEALEPGFLCAQHRVWQLRPSCKVDDQSGEGTGVLLCRQLSEQGTSHTRWGLVAAQEGCPEEFWMV